MVLQIVLKLSGPLFAIVSCVCLVPAPFWSVCVLREGFYLIQYRDLLPISRHGCVIFFHSCYYDSLSSSNPNCVQASLQTSIQCWRVRQGSSPSIRLTLYSSCLLLLVRLGDYIVNLCDFYFYKLIGKVTAFLQLQEFSLHNLPVVSSSSTTTHSPITLANLSSINLVTSSLSLGVPVSSQPSACQCQNQACRSLSFSF
jgi:hypothetical protein